MRYADPFRSSMLVCKQNENATHAEYLRSEWGMYDIENCAAADGVFTL